MDTKLDLSPCREKPRGVNYRRWVIASTGLRQVLRTRFFIILLVVAWTAGLAIAGLGYVFSQTLAEGGWLAQLGTTLGPRPQALASAVGALVLLYPDIVVNGLFTAVFWAHAQLGLILCLLGLTVLVPRLVARDRASNALIIYLSRPLTSLDYLLGKLGIVTGLLVVLWTGPLLFGWLLSMVFAPNKDFFLHSLTPLLRALTFNGISLVVLAAVALGVSAVTRTTRATTILWICVWVIAGALAAPPESPQWLKRVSFTQNLSEVQKSVLRLDEALSDAGTKLPIVDKHFAEKLQEGGRYSAAQDLAGALTGLAVIVGVSSFVFFRRLRPS